ncbi:MAG: NAD(P)-binding domain-containing protein, partial [Crocinitomicaceae bacterium]|nr:NAD(P)-binding domain-containing protein [Crocinitomicaceae bacterium]
GKMGEALMKGILKAKLSTVDNIIVSDVDKKRCQSLEDETGIKTTQENKEVTAKLLSARKTILSPLVTFRLKFFIKTSPSTL